MRLPRGSAWRWVAQGLYAVCLAGLSLLPSHRYGWMRELDPAVSTLPEDGSGNRLVFAAALLGVALVAQLLAARVAAGPRARWMALGLALLAAAVWWVRFGT